MTSRNWPNEFARACATISLLGCWTLAAQNKTPAIALLDAGDAPQWQNWTQEKGWPVITPAGAPGADIDARVRALALAVDKAIGSGTVDPARIYIGGRGEAAAAVFYAISRVPDLWAAGVALGGSPKPAVDSNRIFAGNFALVPVLWISGDEGKAVAEKLKGAGLNLEWQPAAGTTSAAGLIEWLEKHARDTFPLSIDCETNSPAFASCYWIQPVKFDAGERNDVLSSTRIPGSSGAALDLGGFGYKLDDPGPGVGVTSVPPKYGGPLKIGDRLIALDGKPLADVRQYLDLMEKVTEEKPAVVTVQRGKERIRVETRIVLPRRETGATSRVQARYLPDEKEIQIVSRTVTQMRVTVAPEWVPSRLLWNGLTLEEVKEAGCWMLAVEKELLRAERCK